MYLAYRSIRDYIKSLANIDNLKNLSVAQILTELNKLELLNSNDNIKINNIVGYKIKFAQMLYTYIEILIKENELKDLNYDNFLTFILKKYHSLNKEEQAVTKSLFDLRKNNFSVSELERCFNDYLIEDGKTNYIIRHKETNTIVDDPEILRKVSFSNIWFMSFVNTTGSFEYGFDKKSAFIFKKIFDAIENQLITSGDIDISKLEKASENTLYKSVVNNLFFGDYRSPISEAFFRMAVLKPKEGRLKQGLEDFQGTTAIIVDHEALELLSNTSKQEFIRAF